MCKSAEQKEKQRLRAVRDPERNFEVDVRSEKKTRKECKENVDGKERNR
jgi:hypothetical protein